MLEIYFIILGLVFGSFYLVVGTRLSEEKSIIKPASHCDNCGKKLKWYELIPVFSYLFLKGKCPKCHKKIAPTNLIVELFTGFLFLLSYLLYELSFETLIMIITSSILVIIYVSDFKYYIILDSPTIISSIILVVINYIENGITSTLWMILWAGCLFAIVLLIKLLGDKVFKRESLGGGDVKLAIFIGLLLGLKLGLVAIAISAFIALPYAFFLTIKKKEKEVPFGPFLITSTLITFIFQNDILTLLNYLLEI